MLFRVILVVKQLVPKHKEFKKIEFDLKANEKLCDLVLKKAKIFFDNN